MLKNLRCQRYNFHVYSTELTCDGAEDTAAAEFTGIVEQHTSIVVETDIGTVSAADFLLRADNYRIGNRTFLDIATGNRTLNSDNDLVAYTGITTAGTAENTDAEDFLRTAVICHQQT